jgi:hypothetical protein
MPPVKPTGSRIRIKPTVGQVVLADFRADVEPGDTIGCLALLRRIVAAEARRLGRGSEVTSYRLEAYDDRTHNWIEHRP